jgi:hypothetical protein
MKAIEKNIQKLSSSQTKSANAKYVYLSSKINPKLIEDYIDYMDDENINTLQE